MLILKSKHEAALATVKAEAEQDRKIDQRALEAERSINASLRAEIEELRPLADKYTARLERDRFHAANKRKAKP